MDINPQVINEVEFRQKVRGYDPDEVDDFLERMAVAVGQLQDRLREAVDRAATAETRLADLGADEGSTEGRHVLGGADTISRAILTAQRTADALVDDAKREADRLLSAARAHSSRQIAEAEEEAKRAHREAGQRLLAELENLEETRRELTGDIELLEAHLDEQRGRLRSSLDELQQVINNPELLRLSVAPELSGQTVPLHVADEFELTAAAAVSEPAEVVASATGLPASEVGDEAVEEEPDDRELAGATSAGRSSAVDADGGPPTGAYAIDLTEDDHGGAQVTELRRVRGGAESSLARGGYFDQPGRQPDASDQPPRPRYSRDR